MNLFPRIRIIPILIFIAILFLGLRINHFVAILSGKLEEAVFIEAAIAQLENNEADVAAQEEAPSLVNEDLMKQNTKMGDVEKIPEDQAGINEKNIAADIPDNYNEANIRPQIFQPEPNEILIQDREILLSLVDRRKNLEAKKKELEQREILLQVTEKRIDEKFKELQALKIQLESLLGELDKEQEAQIRSLVKIYETMKPVDAARIFDGLELNVLLEVADKMKEAKFAPVLAKMDSDKAKYLTKLLAEKRQFTEVRR